MPANFITRLSKSYLYVKGTDIQIMVKRAMLSLLVATLMRSLNRKERLEILSNYCYQCGRPMLECLHTQDRG